MQGLEVQGMWQEFKEIRENDNLSDGKGGEGSWEAARGCQPFGYFQPGGGYTTFLDRCRSRK